MDFVTVSTGLILPYWMGLPIRYIQITIIIEKIPLSIDHNPIIPGHNNVNEEKI